MSVDLVKACVGCGVKLHANDYGRLSAFLKARYCTIQCSAKYKPKKKKTIITAVCNLRRRILRHNQTDGSKGYMLQRMPHEATNQSAHRYD